MNSKLNLKTKYQDILLLLGWTAIAVGLRLTLLASKPPWTDEFSTLVFSLGNSFLGVPLNQLIALDTLLQPLQHNLNHGVVQVIQNLVTESNHPPLYFVLAHLWMNFWSPQSTDLVSVWIARSLPALLGAASVPAIYGLGWLTFRSRLVSHLSAAMMAVSPYGIFLAQEARHYTLAILWVIASFSCLVVAVRRLEYRKPIPIWLVIVWIAANFLGIATHYFFVLTLGAEAIVLSVLRWRHYTACPEYPRSGSWWQILIVAVGTFLGGLVWLPVFFQNNYGSDLTDWIQNGTNGLLALVNPIFQALAAWITMICLLPVEAPQLPIVIASGFVMLIFFLWALPQLYRGIKVKLQQPTTRLMMWVFVGIVYSAIALFFFFTYGFGIDLTRGARYNFVYFPAVMILVGASLAVCWRTPHHQGKRAVALIWLMGLLSAITVVCNLGYQKYYRPDLMVEIIQNTSQSPILIATTHKTHVQIGEMMGIGREFKLAGVNPPQFLLARETSAPTATLQKALNNVSRPLDLWLINFHAPVVVDSCAVDTQALPHVNGYNYQLYRCY
ncbi:glycosyltransferase family 39 protein [Gloeocapsopsis dulcis]|uniref:Glycosyltransferase n=1 Tax=Gloeocapsopsis dulcis AAB1 = 1H9 TaxID=1433147 RepID=A0A6N8FZB2_9CHRO|nr:glycosyltransferase [Gloeocapsopsis dulcis]MUL37665.1 glycosyltransferase [Gloeocapsopsis dulcis AAB1 = 1H9]WNN88505.1 glycosyltransferase [Gloeocapsopsis dulcis]